MDTQTQISEIVITPLAELPPNEADYTCLALFGRVGIPFEYRLMVTTRTAILWIERDKKLVDFLTGPAIWETLGELTGDLAGETATRWEEIRAACAHVM